MAFSISQHKATLTWQSTRPKSCHHSHLPVPVRKMFRFALPSTSQQHGSLLSWGTSKVGMCQFLLLLGSDAYKPKPRGCEYASFPLSAYVEAYFVLLAMQRVLRVLRPHKWHCPLKDIFSTLQPKERHTRRHQFHTNNRIRQDNTTHKTTGLQKTASTDPWATRPWPSRSAGRTAPSWRQKRRSSRTSSSCR